MMMMAAPKRVAIYTRVSLDRTGEGLAVDRQLARCRKQIEAKDYAGWQEVGHYSDNSISAYTGKHRPEWERLLSDIRAGRVDIVLAWHLDRMTRSVLELEHLILLCEEYNVDIATIEGDIDLSRTTGRLVARILAAVARAEVEMKTMRQLLKMDQLANTGKPFTGGRRAFGYELDRLTVVEEEAVAIKKAAQDYLDGKPLIHIAREWDLAGLKSSRREDYDTTTGWTGTGVRQVLENPRYAGIRMHRGEAAIYPSGHPLEGQRVVAEWPAIIDEDTHLAIVSKIKRSARPDETKAKGPGVHLTLLSGIMVCRKCGEKAGANRQRGVGIYTCSSPARHFLVPREQVDHEVSSAVIAFLSLPGVASKLVPDNDGGALLKAHADAAEARARLGALGDDYADGLIDRATLLRATERLQERIQQAEEIIAQTTAGTALDGFPVGTEQAAELWGELELHQQRGIIEVVTREIVIHGAGPGRRFDATKQISIRFVGDNSIEHEGALV